LARQRILPTVGLYVDAPTAIPVESYGEHIIVYTEEADTLTIRRIFHGRTNYAQHL
jgi:hypothetical protein